MSKDKLFSNCYAFPAYTYEWRTKLIESSLLETNTFK